MPSAHRTLSDEFSGKSSSRLNIETDGAHKLQRIACLNDSVAQMMIESQFTIFQVILKMKIRADRSQVDRNFGESKIVGCKQSDGSSLQQILYHRFGADSTVMRVCSLE